MARDHSLLLMVDSFTSKSPDVESGGLVGKIVKFMVTCSAFVIWIFADFKAETLFCKQKSGNFVL